MGGLIEMMSRKIEHTISAISLSPRTLRVGQIVHIEPSQAWLGIESGEVTVLKITYGDSAPKDIVDTYTDMEVFGGDGCELVDFLCEYWVQYRYNKGERHIEWLPLIIFEDHFTVY